MYAIIELLAKLSHGINYYVIFLFQVMQTDMLEDNWKQLALETVVTLAENGQSTHLIMIYAYLNCVFVCLFFISGPNGKKTHQILAPNW